jgi:short-subunit dehydrogenase
LAVQSDVSQYDAAQKPDQSRRRFRWTIDILVNNAGTTRDMLLAMMPESTGIW